MNIKEELFKECLLYVEKRRKTIEDIITSNKKALLSETKSSAGDKHETGRAMLQLEMEKAGQQIQNVEKMSETLHKMDISKPSDFARIGSIIYTEKANYFLAISIGQIVVDQTSYFVISSASPIGKLLLGKRKGDRINFNGNSIKISSIQ
ncbi:GreA/GreB family elongation factor [Tenacibaculum agarivorans]|uniref:GreA/GreB family elongation factor n=1 Tax=Tenacibaculum agarivorans TaxID=1908389 RepID=UPI00094B8F84|nr:GreA/GreB family elongation factor [Tenacibaculum agarivorans]